MAASEGGLKEIERFASRKNSVARVRLDGRDCVVKSFSSERLHLAKVEYEVLVRCHECYVPAPLPQELRNGSIIMQYLPGESLSVAFERAVMNSGPGPGERDLIADGLASWLAGFHLAFGSQFCRGDSILKNFVLSDGKIYGLDFEEAHDGDPLEDIGQMWASILRMRPSFTGDRFAFASDLTERYWKVVGSQRTDDLPEVVARGLEHYAPFGSDGPELRRWAEKIRLDGLPGLEHSRP